MAKKLAIVISGAVSLGSYEAGVTYEVLEALAQHNERALATDRIEVDVITGASAGGMTASILAKALLCHGPTLRDPYRNPLYKAWVEEVKMMRSSPNDPVPGLLEVERDKHRFSLLNVDTLDAIAQAVLPDDFRQCSPDCPLAECHPAVARDAAGVPQVIVGLAMGNLNGFPLNLPLNQGMGLASSAEFGYSQYKDRFVLRLARPQEDNLAADLDLEEWEEYEASSSGSRSWRPRQGGDQRVSWAQLREVALSSGAFPFAFGVRPIERHSDQGSTPAALYASRDSDRKRKAFTQDTDPFAGRYVYTDGGVFENEPIGLAMNLIASLYGPDAVNDADRYFLFIAPGVRKASSDPFRSGDGADHLSVAKALVAAIMGQSRFQDWITRNRHPKVLAITSEDGKLLGDVFSAFAGFLEEKFRAYDYNVGRDTAQQELGQLLAVAGSPLRHVAFQPVLWPPSQRLLGSQVTIRSSSGNASGTQVVEPKSWGEAMACFGQIAGLARNQVGERDQIQELNVLLDNVDPASRRQIREQILARVRSLVGYLYATLPRPKPSHRFGSIWANLALFVQGAWALLRGPRAMEQFAAAQVARWLDAKLHL